MYHRFASSHRLILAVIILTIVLLPISACVAHHPESTSTTLETAVVTSVGENSLLPTTARPTETTQPTLQLTTSPKPLHFTERLRIGQGVLTGFAFSPDRERILISTPLGISILDAKTFTELWFQPVAAIVNNMAFNPDGHFLAIGQSGGRIQLFDAETGQAGSIFFTGDFPKTGNYPTITWSPDGVYLLIGTDGGGIGLWRAQTGELIRVLQAPSENGVDSATQAVYSGDGRYILTSAWDQVSVWDAGSYQQMSIFNKGTKYAYFSPSKEQSWLALHGFNETDIEIWDWKSGKRLRTLPADSQIDGIVTAISWRADGMSLLASYWSGDRGKIMLWDAGMGKRNETPIRFTSSIIYELNSSLDGSVVYGGGTAALVASGLSAWELSSGRLLYSLSGHEPRAVWRWDNDGIVASVYPSNPELFDPLTGKPVEPILSQPGPDEHLQEVSALIPGADTEHARYMVFTRPTVDPNAVYISRGEKTWELEGGWSSGAYALLWSPDLTRIASPVAVWETDSGKLLNQVQWESSQSLSLVAWAKNGSYLASIETSAPNGWVVVWNPATGQVVSSRQVAEVSLSSAEWLVNDPVNGDILALGGAKQDPTTGKFQPILWLWNLKIDEMTDLLSGVIQEGQVNIVSASPNNRWLAAGFDDGRIIIWDRLTDQTQTLKRHGGLVEHIAWAPNSRELASSSSDGTIIIWNSG